MRLCTFLAALAAAVAQAQDPAGPLVAVNATLHQFEDGPAHPSGYRVMPGETVFYSVQVRGFTVSPGERVRLSYRVEALDEEGVLLAEAGSGKIDDAVTLEDKDWLPKLRYSFLVPPHALPGQLRIVARVKDEVGGREAVSETPFAVRGREVEKSDTLIIRNLRFLRQEDDSEPMPVAAYRPGDALWAKFDITGFRSGERNHVHVTYGLSIVSPSGKVLFTEPQAATDDDRPFYPKKYVSGTINLTVQPKTPPGEYVLVITALDEVGSQRAETRQPFRVE